VEKRKKDALKRKVPTLRPHILAQGLECVILVTVGGAGDPKLGVSEKSGNKVEGGLGFKPQHQRMKGFKHLKCVGGSGQGGTISVGIRKEGKRK